MSIDIRTQPYFATVSQPRPTPAKTPFSQVLATSAAGLVRGVELGLNFLPGGSAVSLAVRGGGVSVRSGSGASFGTSGSGMSAGVSGGVGSAEGPSAGAGTGTGTGGTGSEPAVEDSLRNAQEMNLYYLQIQEQVNAQNRSFSTLSNVLKAEHDTVKTAIGNIR